MFTILQMIESAMREDDETFATQLQAKLAAECIYVSLTTILHNHRLDLSKLSILLTDKKSKQAKMTEIGLC